MVVVVEGAGVVTVGDTVVAGSGAVVSTTVLVPGLIDVVVSAEGESHAASRTTTAPNAKAPRIFIRSRLGTSRRAGR
jgi:hypothetical protein